MIADRESQTTALAKMNLTLPTFLIIGAMKAGTTALHEYLSNHPQIFMSSHKELKFFVKELNWERGLDWYSRQFADAGPALCRGESSPHYAMASRYAGVPRRIASVIPEAKLIYLVRDPVDRMKSAYLHRVAKGREIRSAEQAFATDEPYLNDSRYAWQIEQYLEYFDRSRILILEAEYLRKSRREALERVLQFLDVSDDANLCGELPDVHRTDEKTQPRRGLAEVAKRGKLVLRLLPLWLRRRLARVGATSLDVGRSHLSPQLEAELRGRLASDMLHFKTLTLAAETFPVPRDAMREEGNST